MSAPVDLSKGDIDGGDEGSTSAPLTSPPLTSPPLASAAPAAETPPERLRFGQAIRHGFVALGIYLVLWLLAGALPLVIHPGWAQLNQGGMDPNFYVWGLRWWPYALSHGLNPLNSSLVQAPTGISLAWTTTIPPLAVLAWPLTAVAGPIVSFNVLVALSIPVSAWAGYLLCRRITGRFAASLAGGFVYGFSSYMTSHILSGQLNLSFGPLLPLMAYLVVVRLEKRINVVVFTALMAVALTAQFYLFLETFADLTAILPIAIVLGYIIAGKQRRPEVAKLTGLIGIAYVVSVAASAPYISAVLRHTPQGFVRWPGGMALDAMSVVIARSGNSLGLVPLRPEGIPSWPHGGFVGIALLVVAIALAVTKWSSKTVRFLTVMLVACFLAALGPAIRVNGVPRFTFPWAHLWYLPLVRSSFPSRIMVFTFLVLAVMTAVWLAGPSPREWLRWIVVWIGIVTIATNSGQLGVHQAPGVPSFITSGQYRHYVKPGSTVVVIATHTGNAGLLWQADTDFYFRLAGGYLNEAIAQSSMPLPVIELLTHGMNTPDVDQFRSFVRTAKISAILVQAGSVRWWAVIFTKLHMRHVNVGGVTLYRTSQIIYKGG